MQGSGWLAALSDVLQGSVGAVSQSTTRKLLQHGGLRVAGLMKICEIINLS